MLKSSVRGSPVVSGLCGMGRSLSELSVDIVFLGSL